MTGDRGWFSSLVPVVKKRYITFGDNGCGRVLSEGEIKFCDKITLRRVALVQWLGYHLLSVSQLLDEGFEVLFRPGGSQIVDSRGDLVCMVVPEGQVLTPKFGKESDLWVQLDEESVWRKEGFLRCIRQKDLRSAICFRSAREQLS
jgi:hypothetical protein